MEELRDLGVSRSALCLGEELVRAGLSILSGVKKREINGPHLCSSTHTPPTHTAGTTEMLVPCPFLRCWGVRRWSGGVYFSLRGLPACVPHLTNAS